jgi:hypothetical protein
MNGTINLLPDECQTSRSGRRNCTTGECVGIDGGAFIGYYVGRYSHVRFVIYTNPSYAKIQRTKRMDSSLQLFDADAKPNFSVLGRGTTFMEFPIFALSL